MKAIRILYIILAALGAILLTAAWLLLGAGLEPELLTLDILASLSVYSAVCLSATGVLARFDQAARLGASWVSISVYSIAAIGVMVAGMADNWSITVQAIIQVALALMFVAAIVMVNHIGVHAQSVEQSQNEIRASLSEMRQAVDELMMRHSDPRLQAIATDLRFASPVNTPQGQKIASQFVAQASAVDSALSRNQFSSTPDPNATMYMQPGGDGMERLAKLAQAYKSCYSN